MDENGQENGPASLPMAKFRLVRATHTMVRKDHLATNELDSIASWSRIWG